MQKSLNLYKSALFLVLAFISLYTQACDTCGGGIGGYYMGMLPFGNKNAISLRFRQEHYLMKAHFGEPQSASYFQTIELMGRGYISPKLRFMAILPYHFYRYASPQTTIKSEGIGDALILPNYRIFTTQNDTTSHFFQQSVWVGLGLKLPTGKNISVSNATEMQESANFQLGSGSWDVLSNLSYTLRRPHWGLSLDANTKINTENKQGYQYGNKITSQLTGFYLIRLGKVEIMPNTGAFFDHTFIDKENKLKIGDTGGTTLHAIMGMDIFYKRIAFSVSYQNPLIQSMNSFYLQAKGRYFFSTSWMF